MNIGYNEQGIDGKRNVLYRNFHEIGRDVYLVEISRTPKKIVILLFPNYEKPDEYISEFLTEKQASKLKHDVGELESATERLRSEVKLEGLKRKHES